MEESTYVLVHGAWGGAWCWDEFTKDLEGRSVRWRAVDLPSSRVGSDPLSDLAADAAIVTAAASAVEGPVILVGHSYAGAVITEGKQFPEHSLIIGAPARVIRALDPAQVAAMGSAARFYVANGPRFKKGLKKIG